MKYVIGLGANIAGLWGKPVETVRVAAARLAQIGTIRPSPLYRTVPLYRRQQAEFVNAVLLLDTDVEPRTLLQLLKSFEHAAGRLGGTPRYGPRALDLDILLAGRIVLHSADLSIPHPRVHERGFALCPLLDLIPFATHPATGRRFADYLADLQYQAPQRIGSSRLALEADASR